MSAILRDATQWTLIGKKLRAYVRTKTVRLCFAGWCRRACYGPEPELRAALHLSEVIGEKLASSGASSTD
jgi:hypothetical protein